VAKTRKWLLPQQSSSRAMLRARTLALTAPPTTMPQQGLAVPSRAASASRCQLSGSPAVLLRVAERVEVQQRPQSSSSSSRWCLCVPSTLPPALPLQPPMQPQPPLLLRQQQQLLRPLVVVAAPGGPGREVQVLALQQQPPSRAPPVWCAPAAPVIICTAASRATNRTAAPMLYCTSWTRAAAVGACTNGMGTRQTW
jgi:hypothetical protein